MHWAAVDNLAAAKECVPHAGCHADGQATPTLRVQHAHSSCSNITEPLDKHALAIPSAKQASKQGSKPPWTANSLLAPWWQVSLQHAV